MIYPQDFEQRIGFGAIRTDIASRIQTHGGAEILAQMAFCDDFQRIEASLERTRQMVRLLESPEEFVSSGYVDVNHFLSKASLDGSFLETHEILALGKALELVGQIVSLFDSLRARFEYKALTDLTSGFESFVHIEREIARILDKFGNVRDGASTELASIRRSISDRTAQISRRLAQILQQAQTDGYADPDSSISVRDGRAVIPVAAGNKRKIKGFVFDESASGRTAYIEPLEVVELNNEVTELKNNELREVVRILMTFTLFIRPHADQLKGVGSMICYLDFLVAKARYSISIGGVKPILTPGAEVYLRSARHPLLEKMFKKEGRVGELVPLTIRLTADKHILLISGPNAGGKSVCLKTVGLLQMMLQTGLLVPVLENSEMGIFDSIFIDIGDEQSIENDLSTYSSHLTNIKTMLSRATSRSLVMIDEFGGGTEPVVGGAIAESVLEQFVERGVFGVITTHYSNLKNFAANVPGIENGAMTFDVQRIRPLYSLEMGRSGSSFAFEIARKIGLPESVLTSATEKIGVEQISLEKQLRQAARDKRYWEAKREKIRMESKSAEKLSEQYSSELTDIQKERARLIKSAKEEAKAILANANALVENTIREIKESQAEKERTREVRAKVVQFRQTLADETPKGEVDEKIAQKIAQLKEREARRTKRAEDRKNEPKKVVVAPKAVLRAEPEIGSTVNFNGMTGKILSISGSKATLALGGLSTIVELKKLQVVSPNSIVKTNSHPLPTQKVGSVGGTVLNSALDFSNQIDIRGMRVVEGLDLVRDFVDRSIMVGQRRVSILHGKGTGALKEEIRRYLRSEPAVRSAKDESEEFGGAGITVVEFDF